MRRREVVILSVLLAAILSAGFIANAGSFASNALASAADLIVGIFIAFYLVDRISRRERVLKWQKVKNLSYRAVEAVCDQIMFEFWTTGPISAIASPSGKSTSSKQRPQYETFLALSQEIVDRIDELRRMDPIVVDPSIRNPDILDNVTVMEWRDGIKKVSDEKSATRLHEEQLHEISSQIVFMRVRPHFEKLSLSIFPRILELDEHEDLISSFLEAESAYQDWNSTVDTIEGDWGMPENFAWEAVATFCKKISEMLKIIYFDQHKHDASPNKPG